MSGRVYVVRAVWDEEAAVWVATSDDVPGLVTEAETFEDLSRKVSELVPELLEANGVLPEGDDGMELPISIVAERMQRLRLTR